MPKRPGRWVLGAVAAILFLNLSASIWLTRKDDGYGLPPGAIYRTDNYRLYALKARARANRRVGEYARNLWSNSGAVWQAWVNSLGFRDPEDWLTPVKPPDRRRIVALGDSHTFGLEVGGGLTYAFQLQALLNEAAGEKRYEVVNAGVPGYSSRQGLIYLRREIETLQPDMLIVEFGANDASTLPNFLASAGTQLPDRVLFPDLDAPIPLRYRLQIFGFDRYVRNAALPRLLRRLASKGAGEAARGREPRATPDEFRANLLGFKKFADDKKIPMVFLKIGLPPDYAAAAMRFGRETGVPVIDVDALFETRRVEVLQSPVYREALGKLEKDIGGFFRRTQTPYLFTVDGKHPNRVGHLLIARTLYGRLARRPAAAPEPGPGPSEGPLVEP